MGNSGVHLQEEAAPELAIDFRPFFELGRTVQSYAGGAAGKDQSVPGLFLDDRRFPPDAVTGMQKLLWDVHGFCCQNLIANATAPAFRSLSFVELSLFDPRDSKGDEFHTVLWGPNAASVQAYVGEMNANLKRAIDRGALVPNQALYENTAVWTQVSDVRAGLLATPPDSQAIFVGSYKDENRDHALEPGTFSRRAAGFLEAVVQRAMAVGGRGTVNCALICPLLRPAAERASGSHIRRSTARASSRRGGALFLYGNVPHEFNKAHFALQLAYAFMRRILAFSITETEGNRLQYDTARSFGHELRSVARALRSKWVVGIDRQPQGLLRTHVVPASELEPGCIAEIKVAERWRDTFGTVLYYPLIQTAADLMSLWCMQARLDDSPIGEPKRLGELVKGAWSFAARTHALLTLRNLSVATEEKLSLLSNFYNIIVTLWESSFSAELGTYSGAPLDWSEEGTVWNMAYMRCLVTLFMNCTKHGDPTSKCNVFISPVAAEVGGPHLMSTSIENSPWPGPDPVRRRLEDRWCDSHSALPPNIEISHVVERLHEGSIATSFLAGFSTADVLETIMKPMRTKFGSWNWSGDLGSGAEAATEGRFRVSITTTTP